jgi:hypothetical protein
MIFSFQSLYVCSSAVLGEWYAEVVKTIMGTKGGEWLESHPPIHSYAISEALDMYSLLIARDYRLSGDAGKRLRKVAVASIQGFSVCHRWLPPSIF